MPNGTPGTIKVRPQFLNPPAQGNMLLKPEYRSKPPLLNQPQQDNILLTPEYRKNLQKQTAVQSSTYVYNPSRRFVGTGGLLLRPQKGSPDFKGHIIFVNGNIGSALHNTAGVINSLRDKVPEETHTGKRGQNVNEGQSGEGNLTDPEDRYSQKQADIDKKKKGSLSNYAAKVTRYTISPNLITKDVLDSAFSYSKYERFIGYWNVESNNYKFTETYADYFDAKGSQHFINGSHGLQSKAPHRMQHGIAQGYAWAKANLSTTTKEGYEKNKKFAPWMPQPKDEPITVVMHSQGNAMGLGVVSGIGKYLSEKGWDKMGLNLVMLSVHQNMALNGATYANYKREKMDMLAHEYVLNKLPGIYSRDKLLTPQGINEFAPSIFGNWDGVKKHGVQFTFANDRLDVVTRMGDIPGMLNACGSEIKTDVLPFHISNGVAHMHDHFLDNLFEVSKVDKGVVVVNAKKTKSYRHLVSNFMARYKEYHLKAAFYALNPKERYFTSSNPYGGSSTTDFLEHYKDKLVSAYGELWNAELSVHGAPVGWGLQKNMLGPSWTSKSIFELVKEKGNSIYYRKANKGAPLANVSDVYRK